MRSRGDHAQTITSGTTADEPAPRWKERQPATFRDESPDAPWREQHHDDGECAQNDEIGRAEVGQIALHQIEDDSADDRPLDGADAADHHDEDDVSRPVE